MTPHYWQLFPNQQTDLLLLHPLINRDVTRIQEWCNHWCMIVNRNETMALMVSRSRTVNPPHGDLFLSGVSICASPNLDILRVKFDNELTFEDHVRGIVSRVSQRIGILRLVKRVFEDTSMLLRCYYEIILPILEYFSPVSGLLPNVIFSLSSARCFRWTDFAPIRLFRSCVIDVMLLHCAYCARLIRTLIFVCSVSYHLLLSWVRHTQATAAAHPLEFEDPGVERPNLQGVSCRPRLVCEMTFPTLCLTPER